MPCSLRVTPPPPLLSFLWGQWQLLGDSVDILWVPSHVGVTGNEHADAKASKGAKKAYECVMNQKSV